MLMILVALQHFTCLSAMYTLPPQPDRTMQALKKARKLIENKPQKASAQVLSKLILALESETLFNLAELYQLDYDDFALAMDIMRDWRLDRYYTTKAVLLDLSMQIEKNANTATSDTAPVQRKAASVA